MTWTSCAHAFLMAAFFLFSNRPVTAETLPPPVVCDAAPACQAQFAEAQRMAKEGQDAAALKAFLVLYSEYPDPRLCFGIGRIYQRQGQHEKAVRYYERLLQSGVETDPQKLARIRSLQAEAQAGMARTPSVSEPSATPDIPPRVSTVPQPPLPPSASVASVDNSAPQNPVSVSPTRVYQRWWFWTLIGASAVGIVVGASLAVYAHAPDLTGVVEHRPF